MPRQGLDECVKEGRADADDDGEHHHLDARADDIAEHAFGEKAVRSHRANGTRMKPASVVSLNSRMVTNS